MPESVSNAPEIVKEAVESASATAVRINSAVANTNEKILGEAGAQAMGALYQGNTLAQLQQQQNMISNAARIDAIGNAVVTAAVDKLLHPDVMESIAVNKVMTGNDMGQQLAALMAVLGTGQVVAKTAQTVPPVTAGSPVT